MSEYPVRTYAEALRDWCVRQGVHPAVVEAWGTRYYVDKAGVTWRRGMDGWFMEHDGNDIYLIRHGDMEKIIEEENP
jgi:hypothetical protein